MQSTPSRYRASAELASPSNESNRWKRKHDEFSAFSTRDSILSNRSSHYTSPRLLKRPAMHSLDNHMSFTLEESQTSVDFILQDMESFQRQLSTSNDINQINEKINQWKELISYNDQETTTKMLEISQESKRLKRTTSNRESELEQCHTRLRELTTELKEQQYEYEAQIEKYRNALAKQQEAERTEYSRTVTHELPEEPYTSNLTHLLQESVANLEEIVKESAQRDKEGLRVAAERQSEFQEVLEERRRLVEQVKQLTDELQEKDTALTEYESVNRTLKDYTRYIEKLEREVEQQRRDHLERITEYESQVEKMSRVLASTEEKWEETEKRNKGLEDQIHTLQRENGRLDQELKNIRRLLREALAAKKHK